MLSHICITMIELSVISATVYFKYSERFKFLECSFFLPSTSCFQDEGLLLLDTLSLENLLHTIRIKCNFGIVKIHT